MAKLDRETLLRRELEQSHFPDKKTRPAKAMLDQLWEHSLNSTEGAWDWNEQIKPGTSETYAFLVGLLKTDFPK